MDARTSMTTHAAIDLYDTAAVAVGTSARGQRDSLRSGRRADERPDADDGGARMPEIHQRVHCIRPEPCGCKPVTVNSVRDRRPMQAAAHDRCPLRRGTKGNVSSTCSKFGDLQAIKMRDRGLQLDGGRRRIWVATTRAVSATMRGERGRIDRRARHPELIDDRHVHVRCRRASEPGSSRRNC